MLNACIKSTFTVRGVEKKPARRSPAPPFTTSTLQQEASRKLGMSVSQTMSVAQRLYEAGRITYMRTDSVNLSGEAMGAIAGEIKGRFGEKYYKARAYKTHTKGAQEAHEAIRPSYIEQHTIEGTAQEKRLYELIWKRAVASQMADAEIDRTTAEIAIDAVPEYHFTATGEVITFDGFLKLYVESTDEEPAEGAEGVLPQLKVGEKVTAREILAAQKFTTPPARYSEAALVKRLEELGIGRPSTYAPTITTVINRGYVVRESREGQKRNVLNIKLSEEKVAEKTIEEGYGSEKHKLFPTDIGLVVTDYLDTQFPAILDYNFTATVEKEFDEIAEGELEWTKMIAKFYGDFHPTVEAALGSEHTNTTRSLGVDPATGLPVYARIGRFGPYVQLGENEEVAGSKPKYANLPAGLLLATITLDEALTLFRLPRAVGEYEGAEVSIGTGRFGPYVKHDGKFVSLKKTDDPYSITLERSIELIEEKRKAERERVIKTFVEDPELQVLNGRWGPYLAKGKTNFKIPKGTDAPALTYEDAQKIMADQADRPAKPTRFRRKS